MASSSDNSANSANLMQEDILQNRLDELGISPFKLAHGVAEIRKNSTGKEVNPRNIASTIAKALENPGRSKLETIEQIVAALDGEIVVRWRRYEKVQKGYDEVPFEQGQE